MNFLEAIKSGFSNYINFSYRASRSEHNYWILFTMLVALIVQIIEWDLIMNNEFAPIDGITNMIFLLPNWSIAVRRLHDLNKSGWNILWIFTIIGLIPLFYWCYLIPGNKGDNPYGSDPLSEQLL